MTATDTGLQRFVYTYKMSEASLVREIPEVSRLVHEADEVVGLANFLLTSLIMAHARTVAGILNQQQRESVLEIKNQPSRFSST